MTMPTLIARHNEKVWTTSFLRVYSILENAYRRVQEEYGTFENWSGATITISSAGDGQPDSTLSDRKKLYEYMIKPYIEINKAFLPVTDDWSNLGPYNYNCWPEESFYLDKNPSYPNGQFRTTPAVSLKSGECIVLAYMWGDFMVDLNSKKGPNTLGKDQFIFSFDPKKKDRIKPGYFKYWNTDSAKYCDVNTTAWPGTSCGFWILRYHNMDYLHLPFEEVEKRWGN